MTGLASISSELGGKRLELLKEAGPEVSRVAVVWNPANPGHRLALNNVEAAARALRAKIQVVEARGATDLPGAFRAVTRGRADGLVALDDGLFFVERGQIARLASVSRLPAAYGFREIAEAGGLMVYGPNLQDQWRRAAAYVAKILKGAKPADLPVEQPTKFELVINLKTAKALGLTIPPSLLARADQVIE